MIKGLKTVLGAAVVAIMASSTANAHHDFQSPGNNPQAGRSGPVIFVYGGANPELYYDSIVLADLNYDGTDGWQLLEPTTDGLETEFGPGDEGFYGGRWYLESGDQVGPDADDTFFLCPLLGPGRDTE